MMNPQSRARQISPLSMEAHDPNSVGRYQHLAGGDPYSAASGRPPTNPLIPNPNSPPLAQHPSGSTDNSLGSVPSQRSTSVSNGHISSASSMSRASDGAGFYSPTVSDFHRGSAPPQSSSTPLGKVPEDALAEHYHVLRRYLNPYLGADVGTNRPTRARDKLLRLSTSQFNELSTDVYDELLRREDDRRRPGGIVPPFLPPKQTFHPKRNQARQKLSTLPPERFRQLATDVLYELERRVPGLGPDGPPRPGSSASSMAGSMRAPSRNGGPPGPGMRGPPPNGYRGPQAPGMRGPGMGPGSPGFRPYSPNGPAPPPRTDSRSRAGSVATSVSEYSGGGRPQPRTFQSSTIVPNKSTMVEDDETDEEDAGALGIEKVFGDGKEQERTKEYEAEVANLKEKIQELEERLSAKENEAQESRQQLDEHGRQREEWTQTEAELSAQLSETKQRHQELELELSNVSRARSQSESDLRATTDETVSQLHAEIDSLRRDNEQLRAQASGQAAPDSEWAARHEELQRELAEQKQTTEEVRNGATQFLQEMRLLSEQSELALEKEEQLRQQIASLERETEEWKARYTKARTQLRTLKATSVAVNMHSSIAPRSLAVSQRHELLSKDGKVRDTDVTAYQIAIDELLQASRDQDVEAPMVKAKDVVRAVKAMAQTDTPERCSEPSSPQSTTSHAASSVSPTAVKSRMARDANRLITAARTHATSKGLAPASLIDAAAANLTASVVDFLRAVGIHASSAEELEQDDGGDAHLGAIRPLAPRSNSNNNNNNNMAVPVQHFDAGQESPIIKAGMMPSIQPPAKTAGTSTSTSGGGGWFSSLRSVRSTEHESDSEADYDDYS